VATVKSSIAIVFGIALALSPAMAKAQTNNLNLPAPVITCSAAAGAEGNQVVPCSGSLQGGPGATAGASITYGPDGNGISAQSSVTISKRPQPGITANVQLSTPVDFGNTNAGGTLTYYFDYWDGNTNTGEVSQFQSLFQGSAGPTSLFNGDNVTDQYTVQIYTADPETFQADNLVFSADSATGTWSDYGPFGWTDLNGSPTQTGTFNGSYSVDLTLEQLVPYEVFLTASVSVAGSSASGSVSNDPTLTLLTQGDPTLTLYESDGIGNGPGVSATPLPSTLPMMLTGLTGLLLIVRHRRKRVVCQ
jgi:hypothetical protein